MIDSNVYRHAMREVAASVAIVSANRAKVRCGLTATAVTSVSAEPPQLLVCIERAGRAHDVVRDAGAFAINFLKAEQRELANRFADRSLDAEEKYAEGVWVQGRLGMPRLASALVTFECRIVDVVRGGTHSIFIGSVESVTQQSGMPLIYRAGQFLAPELNPAALAS